MSLSKSLVKTGSQIAALFCACLLVGCAAVPAPFVPGVEVLPPSGCIDLRSRGGVCLQPLLDRARSLHTYVGDRDQYQKDDYWRADLRGDCEDFALWVRAQLTAAGIKSQLVYALTETGGAHIVVSVEGWILDNRHAWVMPRESLSYTWLSMSMSDGKWRSIDG